MNKLTALITLSEIIKEYPIRSSSDKDIKEILSLKEQGYLTCEEEYVNGEIYEVSNILVTNSGHDFMVYAKEIAKDGTDITKLSYSDIEYYGRKSLLKTLGLSEDK